MAAVGPRRILGEPPEEVRRPAPRPRLVVKPSRPRDAAAAFMVGIAAGLVFFAIGAIVFMPEPPPGPDPVTRVALAPVSQPEVDAVPPSYQAVGEPRRPAPWLPVMGRLVPAELGWLAAPSSRAAAKTVDLVKLGELGRGARLDPPRLATDAPARLGWTAPDAVAHMRGPAAMQGSADTAPPLGLGDIPHHPAPEPAGPRHFLQGGYFADRGNAIAMAEKLTAAGLSVLIEQTANLAGAPRWLVLIGPYGRREDALNARAAAPRLLTEAFHTLQGE